ncbi:hypothetical protein WJU23_18760 [Prosthecobacter sp. SYSU 5D2]|uniref:hypothetical protein n=1 Tax=Prosthecobacter sp. SYSU 5D2 TaxID=3134134 RepID=UPI0031FECC39
MPLVSIVCPHCETPVRVQVTDVARSRTCPSCSVPLMLQVAEKEGGAKRKALLVGSAPGAEEAPGLSGQRHFPGQPYHRMKSDPDLARASRRLFMGLVSVGVLILAVTLWSLVTTWKTGPIVAVEMDNNVVAYETPATPEPPAERQKLPPKFSSQMDFEQIVKRRQMELSGMKEQGSE